MTSRREVPKVGAAGLAIPSLGSSIELSTIGLHRANVSVPEGTLGPGLEQPIIVKWRFTSSVSINHPDIADGVACVVSEDGTLYAIEADSGNERWRFGTTCSIQSSPGVVDGVVYFASDRYLYALDEAYGTELWRSGMGRRVWDSSPAVVDGVVYIGGGATLFAIETRP